MVYTVVGIVTWCRNGVTNKQLFFLFKTITSYKSNGYGLVENAIGRYKQKLETLKSYKSCKAITLLCVTSYSAAAFRVIFYISIHVQ
jgi:hypothetical protein